MVAGEGAPCQSSGVLHEQVGSEDSWLVHQVGPGCEAGWQAADLQAESDCFEEGGGVLYILIGRCLKLLVGGLVDVDVLQIVVRDPLPLGDEPRRSLPTEQDSDRGVSGEGTSIQPGIELVLGASDEDPLSLDLGQLRHRVGVDGLYSQTSTRREEEVL